MTYRKRVKPGDIICVPLMENLVAVGIVLHVSKYIKSGIIVGFYDQRFESIEDVDISNLRGPFIDVPNYTGRQLITTERWKVVGNSPELLAEATIPELRIVDHVYYKDTLIRRVEPDEYKNYPQVTGQGGGFVENKLREHFLAKQ